jgi:hypothetical protein
MTVTSNAEFAKRMQLLARPADQFRPTAAHDPDGDCIEFLAKPDPFYAERVDRLAPQGRFYVLQANAGTDAEFPD